MPTYCFEHPRTKEIIEEVFSMNSIPDYITLEDGTRCERNVVVEFKRQMTSPSSCWPLKSRALAIHPSQIKQYAKYTHEKGFPTDYDKQGHPIFKSKKHRKAYAEHFGATDFDGGYGDPDCSGKNFSTEELHCVACKEESNG